MRSYKTLIQLAFGTVILLWLFQMADVTTILTTMKSVNPTFLLGAALLFIAASIMVAFALQINLKALKTNIPIKDAILASFAGQLLSDVTPARTGYFLTPLILRETNRIPIESSMVAVFTTGILNAFLKAIFSIVAVTYFIQKIPLDPIAINTMVTSIVLLALFGVGLSVLIWVNKFNNVIQKMCRIPLLGKTIDKISGIIEKTQQEGRKTKKALLPTIIFILLSIFINATALFLVSKSFGQNSVNILEFVLICPIMSALTYVPITAAGLGVQETGYILILKALNVPYEAALAFALVTRALFTGTDILGLPRIIKVGLGQRTNLSSDKLVLIPQTPD